MSKLFWVESKVILEKCSVCKQPNRIGNSTELSRGEEFLPRGCDFTTTWNLWSPNIKRVSRNLPCTKFLPRSRRDSRQDFSRRAFWISVRSRRARGQNPAEISKSRRPKACRDLWESWRPKSCRESPAENISQGRHCLLSKNHLSDEC